MFAHIYTSQQKMLFGNRNLAFTRLSSGTELHGQAGFKYPFLRNGFCCRKENVQKASKWCEQKLLQKSTLVQPAISVLDIPVDDDIQNRQSPEQPNSVPKVIICFFDFQGCSSYTTVHRLHWHACRCSALLLTSAYLVTATVSAIVHACLACCTQGTLRQRLERTAGSAMEERLLKDPLRYHKNQH